jgi:cell division protein FtsW
MNATTMSYGMRARERMPFAWDIVTLGLVAALLLVGLVMVTSASMSVAAKNLGDPFYFLERQFLFGLCGVLLAWIVTRVPADVWEKHSLALLLLGLALLLLVLIPGLGAKINGARRWMRIGPMNFQVSELAKVLVLTWVCSYCVRKRAELEETFAGLLKPVGLLTVAGCCWSRTSARPRCCSPPASRCCSSPAPGCGTCCRWCPWWRSPSRCWR